MNNTDYIVYDNRFCLGCFQLRQTRKDLEIKCIKV